MQGLVLLIDLYHFSVLIQFPMDTFQAIHYQHKHFIVRHLIQELQTCPYFRFRLGSPGYGEETCQGSGQCPCICPIQGDTGCKTHCSSFFRMCHASNVILGIIIPDSSSVIDTVTVSPCHGIIIIIFPGASVTDGPVLRDQSVIIQFLEPVQRLHVLLRHVYGNQFSCLILHPFVAHTEPHLHHVQGTGIFAEVQSVGVILAVSIRVPVGELIQHIVHIIHGLRCRQTQVLRPVRAVTQAKTSHLVRIHIHAVEVSIYHKGLGHGRVILGQVRIILCIARQVLYGPEGPCPGRIHHQSLGGID